MLTSITVQKTESGQRLDKFIANKLSKLSRNQVQNLINAQQVKINGITSKASQIISCGDKVELEIHQISSENEILPMDLKLEIIYEDDEILVITKPHGLVVHPAKGHRHDTLVNAIVNYLPSSKTQNRN